MKIIPVDDYKIILDETRAAINRGYDHAKAQWRLTVLDIVYDMCVEQEFFTVNDFRQRIKECRVTTHDNRAMGGVMATAKKMKWIEKSGDSINSKVGHFSPLQVWKSLVLERARPKQAQLL